MWLKDLFYCKQFWNSTSLIHYIVPLAPPVFFVFNNMSYNTLLCDELWESYDNAFNFYYHTSISEFNPIAHRICWS